LRILPDDAGMPERPPRFRVISRSVGKGGDLELDLQGYVPTPLTEDDHRRPIEISPSPKISRWRGFQVLFLLIRHRLEVRFGRMTGRMTAEQSAIRTRKLLEGLGGIWVKLGQILSLRVDLLDPILCRELSRLQYQVGGFPWPAARAVLEAELGADALTRVFSHFDIEPFAAASICQVHRATLRKNNAAVVVKVQRPEVERQFTTDLRFVDRLVATMQFLGIGGQLILKDGLREIRAVLREEVDYRFEASNLRRMRKSLKPHGIYVPKLYGKVSTRRVLVMEYVPGVLMSELIDADRNRPGRVKEWLRENEIKRRAVAESLVVTVFRQVLEDNLFHADLHPGNIMLLRESKIALIDLGSVGSLELMKLELYKEINRSLVRRDFQRAADYMLFMAPGVPTTQSLELRSDLTDCIKDWEARSRLRGLPYSERGMSSVSAETTRVMTRYKVPPSWAMLRMGRTLGTLDASLQTLVPDANFLRLYGAYQRDWQRRRRNPKTALRALGKQLGDIGSVVMDARLLLGSEIRLEGLKLKGMLGSLQRVWAVLFARIRVAAIILAAFCLVVWFSQFHREAAPAETRPFLRAIDDAIPNLSYGTWLLIMGLTLLVAHLLRTAKSLLKKPV
jgi:ubiquinone biosynthesis protein